MCGIVGFLDKRDQTDYPLGGTLLAMLQALSCRGPDSAGVAMFGELGDMRLRLSVPPGPERDAVIEALHQERVTIHHSYRTGLLDAQVSAGVDLTRLEERIRRRLPGSEVLCLGEHLSLFKQV